VPQGCADPLRLFGNAWVSDQQDMTYQHAQGLPRPASIVLGAERALLRCGSEHASSDQCNTFAILSGGTLVYSLDRETFQTCGLPAEAVQPGAAAKVGALERASQRTTVALLT
jgi:Ribonuclease P 40kDa (Rpp40) subunit